MLRRAVAAALVLAFASVFAAGCATEQQHTGAAIGGGAGATGSAVGMGGGNTGAGIVIGTLVGGLAGAAVGNYGYDQKRNYAEASSQYAYNYEQTRQDLVRIEASNAVPITVSPGGNVTLATTYTVLGPPNTPVEVTETRQIMHGGKVIGTPTVAIQRIGGTFESRVPLTLPENAERGVYVVRTTVASAGTTDSRESSFTVD